MERYKLEIVNNHGDRYIRCDPAPDGSWVMFRDVEALQARADRNAAGFARVDAEAERAKFLHKQEIAALQKHVAELQAALDFYACIDHYQTHNAAAPNVVQFDRGAKARAALEGKKDER
jgi:hypothetical protein